MQEMLSSSYVLYLRTNTLLAGKIVLRVVTRKREGFDCEAELDDTKEINAADNSVEV